MAFLVVPVATLRYDNKKITTAIMGYYIGGGRRVHYRP